MDPSEKHPGPDIESTKEVKIDPDQFHHLSSVKLGRGGAFDDRKKIEEESENWSIFPWNRKYKTFWGLTVFCALLTVFTETYAAAFSPAGLSSHGDALSVIEYLLLTVFVADIGVNFHLAYYDDNEMLVTDRRSIARHYASGLLWLDIAGVLPWYAISLAFAGEVGQDSDLASYLALFRLVKLVRLHRMKQLFDVLQYNPHISLMWLTLLRNFGFAILWSHFAACIFYFIARQYDFDPDDTWIGGVVIGLSGFERYCTSLYWSVVTFTTVGYGDFSPKNSVEQIWSMVYMLLNMVAHAWIIGSITLLIVKQDEKTGAYREAIQTLKHYSILHHFPSSMEKKLRTQLKLDFNNREISDEIVLGNFPAATRRKVLRRLYIGPLMQTNLMDGIRQQFVDAFLSSCRVEIFSPGEEILQRGSISADLYLLVAGSAELLSSGETSIDAASGRHYDSQYGGTSIGESRHRPTKEVSDGDFINAVPFFTESPQLETVKTKTVCKTLTLSRATYKSIAEDHPGSVGKLLQNLLAKTQAVAAQSKENKVVKLPTQMSILRTGSVYEEKFRTRMKDEEEDDDFEQTVTAIQTNSALTAVQDLVNMHMNKLKDDHTTRFLFAASRGDADSIALMCAQGFDPNSADYDSRTALMVAAMKGNSETVQKLLECGANPNLVDMHGSSALYEATRNGHDDSIKVLLKHGASLCMKEDTAASKACQAVFDGDMLTLRRLLQAGLAVDAGDYDMRRAAHIAAAEGNVPALKLLVEYGADLGLKDRFGNSVDDEAKRAGAGQVLTFLNQLRGK